VKEELSGVPIIVVMRRDVPLAPAAGFLLDLMKRTAEYLRPGDRRVQQAG
jgi:hypothetical protein